VAILTISASTGYAAGECVGVSHSFNSSPGRARLFYGANITVALIAAAIILIPGAPLLSIALNANALATVLLPVTLVFLIMLASDRQMMGRWANKAWTNRIAVAIVAFVSLCGAAYGIDSFLLATHLIGGGLDETAAAEQASHRRPLGAARLRHRTRRDGALQLLFRPVQLGTAS
jgi:Mn2+/Fe2+ NRAMP family transporter